MTKHKTIIENIDASIAALKDVERVRQSVSGYTVEQAQPIISALQALRTYAQSPEMLRRHIRNLENSRGTREIDRLQISRGKDLLESYARAQHLSAA